jgi:hypothetical protein
LAHVYKRQLAIGIELHRALGDSEALLCCAHLMPDEDWISSTPRKSKEFQEARGLRSTQDDVPPQELRVEAVDSGNGYWIAKLVNTRHGGLAARCRHEMLHLTKSDAVRCGKDRLRELIAAESRRGEWSPGPEDQPIEAPLQMGARIEYTGLSSRGLKNGMPIHRGEIGVVIHVESPGAAGTEHELPEDGYCIVRFHDIDGEEDTIYPRFDDEGDWRTRYRLAD